MPFLFLHTEQEDTTPLMLKDAAAVVEHFRQLIANRAGGWESTRVLRRLRGESTDGLVEGATALIDLWHRIIAWAQAPRSPGDWFEGDYGSDTYRVFHVSHESPSK